jgi:hypothetical protein
MESFSSEVSCGFYHEPSMVRTDNTPRVEPLKPGASLNRSDGGIDSMTRMLF